MILYPFFLSPSPSYPSTSPFSASMLILHYLVKFFLGLLESWTFFLGIIFRSDESLGTYIGPATCRFYFFISSFFFFVMLSLHAPECTVEIYSSVWIESRPFRSSSLSIPTRIIAYGSTPEASRAGLAGKRHRAL